MASDSIHLPAGLVDRATDHFPWDIVVLAVLAVGLGICLYQILGRRIGAQALRQEMPGAGRARNAAAHGEAGTAEEERLRPPPLPGTVADSAGTGTEREIPAPATRVGEILTQIGGRVSGFTPATFLDQADASFRKIVPAIAAGDRTALSGLLASETEDAFLSAINARTEAGQTQRSDLRGIERLSILDAAIVTDANGADRARIEVSIVSRQVNLLTDRDGNPVLGTDAVTEFHDLWLFERALDAAAAPWRLAASRPA